MNDGKVFVNSGTMYGRKAGQGYLRLNIACPRHEKDTEEKILCRPPVSTRSHIGNLRQIRKQGKGRSSKRKGNRRCPFLFAPAAGRGTLPPSADGESPAEVQRKTPRPERANPLTQFVCPGQPVQKRSRPLGANLPAAVRVPRSAGAEKTAAPSGRTRLRGSGAQSPGAAKKSAAHGHLSTCENQIFLRFTL